MLGYLKAIQDGADLIIDTDDDNIPKQNWAFPDFEQKYDYINDNKGFVNVCGKNLETSAHSESVNTNSMSPTKLFFLRVDPTNKMLIFVFSFIK